MRQLLLSIVCQYITSLICLAVLKYIYISFILIVKVILILITINSNNNYNNRIVYELYEYVFQRYSDIETNRE